MKVSPVESHVITAGVVPEAELELRLGGSVGGFQVASLRLKGDRWASLAAQALDVYAKASERRWSLWATLCDAAARALETRSRA